MKKLLPVTLILFGQISYSQFNYPTTKTVDSSDIYWGITVQDPYRWLEDIKNPEVEKWFKAEADYTNAQMAKIPNQDKLITEMKVLSNLKSATYMPVAKAGGKYFYQKLLPDEQVFKLYYKQGENGKEILLFDPQHFVEGKTFDCMPTVSDDGSKIAMILSEAGSEIGDTYILDVATGKFLPDVIPNISGFTGVSFADGSNTEIIYVQFKSKDVHDSELFLNPPSKLHVLGTPVEKDIVLVSSKKNPELNISPELFPVISIYKDSPYMILVLVSDENNRPLYYAKKSELKSGIIHWKPLVVKDDEVRKFFIHGTDFYFLTTKDNPQFKIAKTNLDHPDISHADIIAEGSGDFKISGDDFVHTKDYLVFNKSKNDLEVKPYAYEFNTGKLSEIDVPLKGNVSVISDLTGDHSVYSNDENEIVLFNSGWTVPINFYSFDLDKNKLYSTIIFTTKYNYPNLENLVFEDVEVPSWDGALVPLSIVYDKTKLKKDGSNIAYMSGYGAYGFSEIPVFTGSMLPLLNRGVIMAYPSVRGGGSKGNDWYLAGKKTTKPNTWKDFNACAEWLISNKYTSPDKFGIRAKSAGGILIGRAITERPDLYKAAILEVGVLNPLRFELTPNGPQNIPEFGTVEIEEEFKALLEMDAYQHIQKGVKYPAQLITTGWNDPRVVSYIPAKFAAKMQTDNGSKNPVFLDVDYSAGHGGGSTTDEAFAQTARIFSFLLWQCGDKEFQP